MYLQSAEILNYHGIRNLKIDFESKTSALIGENTWGKSSLLSALWLALGQGPNRLGLLSEYDVYVPVEINGYRLNDDAMLQSSQEKDPEERGKAPALYEHGRLYKSVKLHDRIRNYYLVRNELGNTVLKIRDEELPSAKQDPSAEETEKERHKNKNSIFTERSLSHQKKRDYAYSLNHDCSMLDQASRRERAKHHLECEEELNDQEKQLAKADCDFYAADTFNPDTGRTVIKLIFCESSYGSLNSNRRMHVIKNAAYRGEDDLFRITYRITGLKASEFIKDKTPTEIKEALNSGTVLYCPGDCDPQKSGSIRTYNREARSRLYNILTGKCRNNNDDFVTLHEILDGKNNPVPDALPVIRDLITLNPLLRMRDRRMLKVPTPDDIAEQNKSAQEKQSTPDRFRTIFSAISNDEDLNAESLNRGLNELNVIASKYLINYTDNIHLKRIAAESEENKENKHRTARDIVSQPVSIGNLNSLKQSLEDEKPSRSKILLSLLAGAVLLSSPDGETDPYAKPILVLEDIEGRFHPTLLLTLWSILEIIPAQKIVTTNSASLLSAMSVYNIRRLCRMYYDVRCYNIDRKAFSVDDERRIAFHIRMSRPDSFFARCWILVEGETEIWMLNEIAGILGISPGCEGIKFIEFAQCGLSPLIKLARQLGIAYYVLTDGDDAGHRYATTVQSFTGSMHLADHLSVIPHTDIEHYLYVSGFADVYQKAAGLIIRKPVSDRKTGITEEHTTVRKAPEPPLKSQKNNDSLQKLFSDSELEKGALTAKTLSRRITAMQQQYKGSGHITLKATEVRELQRLINEALPLLRRFYKATSADKSPAQEFASVSKGIIESFCNAYINNIRKTRRPGSVLTKKQNKAVKYINEIRAELLYNFSLSDNKPQTAHLTENLNDPANDKKVMYMRKADNEKLRCDFMIPLFFYNGIRGLLKKQKKQSSSKIHQNISLKNNLSAEAWTFVKNIQARLNGMLYTIREVKKEAEEIKREERIRKERLLRREKDNSASVERENQEKQILNAAEKEIELSHADPIDAARILKKARQMAGTDYKSIGALDQETLKKQGWTVDKVIDSAIHKKSKPGLAIMVVEQMQLRGRESVPQLFNTMFTKIRRLAGNNISV